MESVGVVVETVGNRATRHNGPGHKFAIPPYLLVSKWFAVLVNTRITSQLIQILGPSVVQMILIIIGESIVDVDVLGECLFQIESIPARTLRWRPGRIELLSPVVQYLSTRSSAIERHAECVVEFKHSHIVGHEDETSSDDDQADRDDHERRDDRGGRQNGLPCWQSLLAKIVHVSNAIENVGRRLFQLGEFQAQKHSVL